MAALPNIALPTADVGLPDGSSVTVRGLSRGEAVGVLNKIEDVIAAECQLIAHGLDLALEEVEAWYHKAPVSVVQPIVEKIMDLSGLLGLGKGQSEV